MGFAVSELISIGIVVQPNRQPFFFESKYKENWCARYAVRLSALSMHAKIEVYSTLHLIREF